MTARASVLRLTRLMRKELRQLFRDPRTKRIILVSPILQLLLFGYAVNTDVRNVSAVVLDRDRTTESRELVATFTASGYFRVVRVAGTDADVTAALDAGVARVALVIPARFAADLKSGRSPAIQVLLDGTSSNTATVAQGYATRLLTEYGQRHALRLTSASSHGDDLVATRAPGGAAGGVDLRSRAWFNPELASRAYNVPAVIGMLVLIMSLMLTAMAVVRERELGTMDQLLVSPLSPGELMLGKTLPVAGVAMIQLGLVASVALLWFDIPFRGSFLALLLGGALFILSGLSLGLLISTISKTQQEAFLSIFLLILPAVILSGFLYPVETMPTFFRWLTLANPLRHFLEIIRDLFLKGAGIADLWVQFAALAVMAAGGLALAIARFRASIA